MEGMNDKEWLKEKNEALARLGVHWVGNTLVKIGGMKLSEYLHSKMGPSTAVTWRARTVEQIEEWIVEWYKEEFERSPPMWLVRKRNEKSKSK